MKKLIIFMLISVLFSGAIFADTKEYNIYTAAEKSVSSDKPILYVIASTKCSHCVHFINNTITPNIKSINDNFVFALSNLANDDKIPSDILFKGTTPSTYIISPQGEVLVGPIEGDFNQAYYYKLLKEFGNDKK